MPWKTLRLWNFKEIIRYLVMGKKKKEDKKKEPRVHKDLEGFEFEINSFGEITSNKTVEDINKFLNKNVKDKKLKDRKDLDKD